jgi:carboxyl-terminal processing protease
MIRIGHACIVRPLLGALIGIWLVAAPLDAGNSGDRYRGRMMEILNEVSSLVKEHYYDPTLKNLDWKAAVDVARNRIREADNEGEMSAAISGLLARLNDSHTYFLRPHRLEPVIFGFRAKAFGDEVRIYEIMPGSPAEAVGLKNGDRILSVEDFVANRQLIDDEMRYFQYLDPHATMKLKIVRNGGEPKEYLINGKQPLTSTKEFRKLYEDYREEKEKLDEDLKLSVKEGEVTYLRFPSFMVSTSKANSLLKQAKTAASLVLDLREDGGGREDTMKDVLRHFFREPTPILTAISRDKKEEVIAKPEEPYLAAPLFVLADSHSASAAEVVARILQMTKRATIIGDVTAGKVNRGHVYGGIGGAVYVIPFGVSITVSRGVMPDGLELEGRGVTPDLKCLPTEEDLRSAKDPCLDRALELARDAASKGTVNSRSR